MLESVWYYSRRSNICLCVHERSNGRPFTPFWLPWCQQVCDHARERILIDTAPPSRRCLRPVPSRPDRQKCHPAFCIFHTTDRSTDHSSVLGILCTVIIINLIFSQYRLFISITGSKCGKRKRQYFRNRCGTWNGIALASVNDMFTIHLFNNPISVHNRYGLPKPIGNSPIKSSV